ncbi:Heterokaryon incompatibility protein 6, OR allele [Pseudocercospora fuligena]|uniref:Heterokaryon incompatibility protein 6, OR allele n=1 Tax=Pseudocercospora fuligena TaxID=685502 RepID=A0A8H6RHN8_9PEZI|nr:Heterokaryon incompatibility protein 6, OR allele [Pseudocercospora fuligena]
MCINNTAVRMDSGYINSLYDLGINSHPDDAISFRKVLECAPIKTEGFSATYIAQNLTSDVNAALSRLELSLSGNEFYALFYGPSGVWSNATFISNNGTSNRLQSSSFLPYRVGYSVAGTNFSPIEQLQRSDTTVTLLFLTNVALYPSPVTDPWFNAQIPTGLPPGTEILDISVVYGAQHPVSVLGCADWIEICYEDRDTGSQCAAVNSLAQANFTAESVQLKLNERQLAILDRFYGPIQNGISLPIDSGPDGGLLASTLAYGGASPSLPDNQWILELEKWFATVLISAQLYVTEWVTGYEVAAYDQFKKPPSKDHEWMCDNQIVQRNDHASFSVLGLAIILCFGGLAGVINLLLPNIWPRLRHRRDLSRYRNELWKHMELLEMQQAIQKGQSQNKHDKHESASTMDSLRGKLMPLVSFKSRRSVRKSYQELTLIPDTNPAAVEHAKTSFFTKWYKLCKQIKHEKIYSTLCTADKQIRLLNVSPTPDEHGRLSCILESVSLASDIPPRYEAISWRWGDTSHTRHITLNSELFLVPESAFEVLTEVCVKQSHSRVWLDILCINQENIDERSQQVPLMKDIYTLASQVVVWLGIDRPTVAQRAFESFDLLKRQYYWKTEKYTPSRNDIFRQSGSPIPAFTRDSLPQCDWKALEDFFSVSWFSRLWVCQEVMLNHTTLCLRGTHECSWFDIGLAAQWLIYCGYWRAEYMAKTLQAINSTALVWSYTYCLEPDWGNLLELSTARRAAEPLDHVYAFLGVLPSSSASERWAFNERDLQPDYRKDPRFVFAAATRVALFSREEFTNALTFLWLARVLVPPKSNDTGCSMLESDSDDWPSWVPRYHWTVDIDRGSPVPMTDWHNDDASGPHFGLHCVVRERLPLVLELKGVIVGKVRVVSADLDQRLIGCRDALSREVLCWRRWACALGVDEATIAMTLTSRKTHLDMDAALEPNFVDQYRSFIAECLPEHSFAPWTGCSQPYVDALWRGSANKKFFISDYGRIGMCHPHTKPGDCLCILFTGMSPFVLRPEKPYWRFVGAAYVHSIMHGEYVAETHKWWKSPSRRCAVRKFRIR